jgi:hypothetical protein
LFEFFEPPTLETLDHEGTNTRGCADELCHRAVDRTAFATRVEIEINALTLIKRESRADNLTHSRSRDAFGSANVRNLRKVCDARSILCSCKHCATDRSRTRACACDDLNFRPVSAHTNKQRTFEIRDRNQSLQQHRARGFLITVARNLSNDLHQHTHRVISAALRANLDRAHRFCIAGHCRRRKSFDGVAESDGSGPKVKDVCSANTNRFSCTHWHAVHARAVATAEVLDVRTIGAK